MPTGLIRIFLFLGIWGLGIGQSWGRIVYVDSSRTAGTQNGTSWTNAYSNLQTALTAAVAGDSLWVAKGTYYPGASGANSASFNTKNNVRLFGGFTGFSGIQETSINQRNWTTNLTILSGDLDRSGGFSSLDAFHVVASTGGVDTSATLNGFRITGGNANVVSGANERGGGVFFFGAGIRLENCDIRGNRAASFGGGVYGNGHIVMRNCFVRNNTCSSQGGGFYLAGNTNVHRYYNCVFANNTSTSFGGAFFTGVTNMRFYNCTFTGNVGSSGNVMLNAQSSVILQNCIVWGNGNPSSAFVSGNPTITRSIVEGGYASGTGIINANPNFLDSDYRIKACSPAVDAGDALAFVPTDLSGAPRPFDADLDGLGEWDLGAFEVQVPAVAPATNPILGSNPACSNQQNALYQPATNNSSTNQYVWTLSGGGTIDGSNTNSSVRIDWGTTLGTYTLTMLEYGSVTGCSTTNSVNITLAASPVATLSPSGNGAICSGDSILLTGSGVGISRQWYYNGAPIPGATNTSYFAKMAGVYNYMLTSSNGCSDTATVSYRLSLNPLPTFTIGSTLGSSICQNQITTLIAPSNGTAWQWFRNGNPIGGATSSTYNTGLAGSYDVRYTNSNGCRNLATSPLVIIVNPLPVVSVTPTGHDTICPSTNLQLSATSTGATAYQWYLNGQSIGSATNSTFPAALTGWYNAIITDGNGCRDSAAAGKRLTVADFEAPTAVCQNLTRYLNSNGSTSITATQVNNGSTDDCAVVNLTLNKTIFGCTDLGTSPTTLTVTDIGGNTRSCTANITVLDTIRPHAVCSNKTVYLSAAGSVTLTFGTIDLNSTDNCGISNSQISPNTFNCSQIGSHPVVGTIQDASGNVRTCNAVVTVADSTKPNAICASPVLTLDAFGFASLTPAQADNGSNDNCGIGSRSLTKTTFGCLDVPGVSQTLQITDVNGNSSTCQVFVRIQDPVAPIALCQDTMIFIDMTGQSILTPLSIDNGSSDNCSITGRNLSQSIFTCQDTGLNVVTMTVFDADTNLATCTSQVRVFDTIAPFAVCTDLTIYLDSLGNAVVNPLQMGANSTDNCGFFATAFVDVGSYTCSGIGPHPTLLVMGDVSGVRDSCTGLVTVADSTGPFMACRNLSLNLVGGVGTITASQIDNGTTDNCQLDTLFLDRYQFSCTDVGPKTVRLTGIDIHGNDNSCTAVVTVAESTPPQAACRPFTTYLNASGLAVATPANIDNGSTDNCGIAGMTLSVNSFDCSQTGSNPVTLTVTDGSGNQNSCTTTVTVLDTIGPNPICNASTVFLNNSGTFNPSAVLVSAGSTDNCSILTRSVTPASFSCQDTGTVVVTITLTDAAGNARQCQASLLLRDTLAPVAVCATLIAYLDASGQCSVTAAQMAGGSTDNCGISGLLANRTQFSCTDLGIQSVAVGIEDISGNASSCNSTITILDTIAPVATCIPAIDLYLNASGSANLTSMMVDDGSTDACGVTAPSLSQQSFGCAQAGIQTISMTVADASGNSSICTTQVTVLDTLKPSAQCSSRTVGLGASGIATIPANLVGAQSLDACSGLIFTSIPASFDCTQKGPQTVRILVEDIFGNRDSCTTTVNIVDNGPPDAVCQPMVIQLDSSGTASLTAAAAGIGSNDNCGLASLTIDQTFFTCGDLGGHLIYLVAFDSTGLTDTCLFTLTVADDLGLAQVDVNLGPDTVLCNGGGITLAAPSGLSLYQWSNGLNTPTLTTNTAGTYWVQVTNGLGCTGGDSIQIQTSVVSNPNLVSASGNLVICQNDQLVLSVDPLFNSYLWSNGDTTSDINITTGGNYSVQVTDALGCSRIENISIQSVPFPAPSPQITPGELVTICEGSSVQLDAGAGYFSYAWSNGQSSQTIQVNQSGTFTVQVWNGFGCDAISQPVVVTLNQAPVPAVILVGNMLTTSVVAGAQYQWFLGGSPILGATGNTWTPQGPGSYTVKVIYPNGCVQYSEPFPFVVEVAESVDLENNLLVYPNPTSRFLTIGSNKTIQGKIQYFLTDALGRSHLMGFWNGLSAEENLDLGGLPAGVYTIRIEHASGRFSLLVLKQ